MSKETEVFYGEANYGRSTYLYLKDNKVIFDCSDEEYGPVEFDLELLEKAIEKHKKND